MTVATRTKRPVRRVSVLEYTSSNIAAGRVDREQGIIRRVKILGGVSKNGRVYPRSTRTAAAHLYEGARVNINHPPRMAPDMERDFDEWVGVLENVQDEPSGLYADLRLRKKHPKADELMEAAEEFPTEFGMSHNAVTYQTPHDGKMVVTEIETVRSVDVVCRPATTRGIFESEDHDMDVASDPMLSPTQEGDDVTTDTSDPNGALLVKIVMIINGEGTPEEKGAECAALIEQMLSDGDDDSAAMDDGTTETEDDDDPDAMESVGPRRKLGRRPARVNYSDPAAIARALLSPPPPESMPLTAFESQGKFRRVKPDADRYDDPKKCAQLLTSR